MFCTLMMLCWPCVQWQATGQPYHLRVSFVLKSGSLNLLEPSGPVQAFNGIALPLPIATLSL